MAPAAEPEPEVEEVVVTTDRARGGERVVDRAELSTLPLRAADEVLRALPGLQLSAHGGRGKAWQILYRGVDAEHGSDVEVAVEGIGVNEPSNVHAHGYVDLAFVPTVLLQRAHLVPGADRAAQGDFATAASVDLGLGLAEEGLAVQVTGGTDRSGALRLAWRPEGAAEGTFVVGEADLGEGVAAGRGWRHARVAAGTDHAVAGGRLRTAVLAYHGDFDSPGTLRAADVETGRVGLYAAYPGSGGGRSDRLLAFGRLTWDTPDGAGGVTAWAGARALQLDQDFTGFLDDPVRGDATRQHHSDLSGGVRGTGEGRWQLADHPWRVGGGVQVDAHHLQQRTERVDRQGEAWRDEGAGTVRQAGLTAWGEAELGWRRRLALLPGVRVAGWWQEAAPDAAPAADAFASRWIATVAPRVRLEGRPHERVLLFAGYGRGYRPPRAVDGVLGALVTSDVVQGGVRAAPLDLLALTATAFWGHLDDEQVFDHLSGAFVGRGATRRVGGELVVEVRPLPWLRADLAASFADGRFEADDTPVPYAPRFLLSAGVGVVRARLPKGRLGGGLRVTAIAPRPLPLGFASSWAAWADLVATWEVGRFALGLQVDNLLGTPWRSGEFVFPSWWDTDRPRTALPALHLAAGTPTAARLSLEVRW
ncbi:MAG: TonB-dependent receptor [Alphaproteobacteria bacterium]|nr:TonB-dependent receptor [Alphaproteobacteria bacterium]